MPSISYLPLFQSASYACSVGASLIGASYGCWVIGPVELELEYGSCDRIACISFFKVLTFLIIQSNPASAIMQATPSTAPTAAPTTVEVLLESDHLDEVAVVVDVTVTVVVASVAFESFEVVVAPGITLSMKRPR